MSKQQATEATDKADMIWNECPNDSASAKPCPDSLQEYVYEPLDPTIDSIRVIEMHPGAPGTPIRCTMRNVRISNTAYTCLSYTWLPSHPQHQIEVNNRSLSIGENLYQFLSAYRDIQDFELNLQPEIERRTLWIDAISIHQMDTNEKNHQVQQMGEIYKSAKRVLVWLGVLGRVLKAHFDEFFISPKHSHLASDAEHYPLLYEFLKRNHTLEESTSRVSRHQALLFKNPYWNRMWIAQEILLPSVSKVFIFDGAKNHEMGDLHLYFLRTDGIRSLQGIGKRVEDRDFTQYLGSAYLKWRTPNYTLSRQTGTKPSLLTLLQFFSSCGCQDSRDHIFALLALVNAEVSVDVDYNLEPVQIFRTLLGQSLSGGSMEDVLFYGAHLIMALGIRKPAESNNKALGVQSGDSLSEIPSKVTMVRPQFDSISLLSWTKTCLVLNHYSVDWKPEAHEQVKDCIFIAIFDAGNVHGLEYVIESNDSGVSVQYARAFEYLHGTAQISEPGTNRNGQVDSYNWLNMPSEDVYYFLPPFRGDAPVLQRVTTLGSWKSPSVEVVDHHNSGPSNSARPSMRPAKRYFESKVPWRHVSSRCLPRILPGAFEHVDACDRNMDRQVNPRPTISRPCTYRKGAMHEQRGRDSVFLG